MTLKMEIKEVSKIFGPHPKKTLRLVKEGKSKEEILKKTGHTVGVERVSLDIQEGEMFVIMGLSGSGKSTLIRCLNLLNRPTSGSILVDGEDITTYDRHKLKKYRQKKIAMVFQHFGLFDHRTIIENVSYGLEVRKVPLKKRMEIAQSSLETVGLKGWEDKYPNELSGGMQQRVGLARALANDPDILLMDEPFSALDPLIRREMQLELIDLQNKLQKTVIFITHDVNEAFKIGDRVAVMKDGKVEQVGTPEAILENPANDYIEAFVKDIDRSKIIQAEGVMIKPNALVRLKDGLNVAIKEMKSNGLSSVYVVDKEMRLKGLVTIDDALEAKTAGRSLESIMTDNFEIAAPDDYMQDLIDKAIQTKYPIAIVREEKLVGLVPRAIVLSSLASQ
ncbi:glycine betaine/proline transport system ATP-binding protein [Pullulanibacillus pueri]|uniref:Quaternary amine transport ATP-binding protein n=1 Tax=Pullulanibacillus pueri TaxID=1437324 RepID=A0A8J2ZZG7_9BACL|nr:glycine betaine/L-proline ABC transporter ATP-binding protein [Pullulanibacillus pueri]MBM7683847.1 glycine betaine/proline transport system ATP-binding protein [Pullulanibacillus pueri]GGH87705.1 glycine betaine/L-proline ABC transporter ATP-binding protein [Pullulanibacillus pueri]